MNREPPNPRPFGRLLVAGLAATLLLAGCEPLGADELRREVETIGSLAAEGSVLAQQVADQDTKRTFARVHSRELADAAEHSAERLTDAHPGGGLTDDVNEAISLANAVEVQLGQIEVGPDEAERAADASERLRGLSQDAGSLADEL